MNTLAEIRRGVRRVRPPSLNCLLHPQTVSPTTRAYTPYAPTNSSRASQSGPLELSGVNRGSSGSLCAGHSDSQSQTIQSLMNRGADLSHGVGLVLQEGGAFELEEGLLLVRSAAITAE